MLYAGLASRLDFLTVPLFVVLMLATGIPHGATDHVVYAHTQTQRGRHTHYGRFLGFYLGAMVLYALAWWAMPVLSLVLFLLISCYHFGQSQWLYVPGSERAGCKISLYVAWGGTVLGALLWFNLPEALAVLAALLPNTPGLAATLGSFGRSIWLGLLLLTLGLMGLLYWQRRLSRPQLYRELLNLVALHALFLTAPLLVGFAIYFGLWHSLRSIRAEVFHLQQAQPRFNYLAFARRALPFTLISLAGLGLLWLAYTWVGTDWSPYLLFFIAISTVTLPHMVFMQGLYASAPSPSRT